MPARKVRPVPSVALLVVTLLAFTACTTPKAPQTTAPPGYTVVRDASSGFAVAIPADWVQIPLPQDLDVFDKKARALSAQNAHLGPAILQARQLLQFGGKLMAVSPNGVSIVNLTVDKTKEKTLDEIGRSVAKSLTENGATQLASEPAVTGAGPALKLTFRYPIPGTGDTPTLADEVQFHVLHNGRSFVITLINPTDDTPANVASSFRLR